MRTIDTPLPPELMVAFQRSVEKHFAGVAESLGVRLLPLSPSLYGFLTEHAVVTIGVYHGHFPGLCVKLRDRRRDDILGVDDQRDIGLANVVAFVDPSAPPETQPEHYWTEESLDAELSRLASDLLRHGRSFLTDAKADWTGLRRLIEERIKRAMAEMPWLRRFSRDA